MKVVHFATFSVNTVDCSLNFFQTVICAEPTQKTCQAQAGTAFSVSFNFHRLKWMTVRNSIREQAIILNIVFTMIAGLILIFHALTSIESILSFIALGVLAIVAAIAYTVGNKPYGYIGLGDLSVFIFFGLLGVSGTYFLHTGHVEPSLFQVSFIFFFWLCLA